MLVKKLMKKAKKLIEANENVRLKKKGDLVELTTDCHCDPDMKLFAFIKENEPMFLLISDETLFSDLKRLRCNEIKFYKQKFVGGKYVFDIIIYVHNDRLIGIEYNFE